MIESKALTFIKQIIAMVRNSIPIPPLANRIHGFNFGSTIGTSLVINTMVGANDLTSFSNLILSSILSSEFNRNSISLKSKVFTFEGISAKDRMNGTDSLPEGNVGKRHLYFEQYFDSWSQFYQFIWNNSSWSIEIQHILRSLPSAKYC